MDATNTPSLPIDAVIERLGGASAAGVKLGITPQAVGQWKRVPVERTLVVERLTGIPRHELRPDIYPAPAPELDRVAS